MDKRICQYEIIYLFPKTIILFKYTIVCIEQIKPQQESQYFKI